MELEFNLPKPLVFEIAEPWIIYGGRIFQPESPVGFANDNYIELNGKTFLLNEVEIPIRLEELYFIRYKDVIEEFEKDYMKKAISTEYISKKSIEEQIGTNKVLSMLVTDVLPVITHFSLEDRISEIIDKEKGVSHGTNFIDVMASQTYHSDNLHINRDTSSSSLRSELRKQKDYLIKSISKEYKKYEINHTNRRSNHNSVMDQLVKEIERNIPSPNNQQFEDGSILNTQIFPKRNSMYYNKDIYELIDSSEWVSYFEKYIDPNFYKTINCVPSSMDPKLVYKTIRDGSHLIHRKYLSRLLNKFESSKLKINGSYYFPILMQDEKINDMIILYKKLIEKQVKLKAIEHNEFQAVQIYEISKQREQISKIVNLDSFELNGAGYEKKSRTYYVYVTTPPYALKSPHIYDSRKYLPMNPAKIGVEVSYDNSSMNFNIDNPVVMNLYKHPFLEKRSAMQAICLGKYSPSSARRLPPAQAIMTLLSKAKENIMMGYRSGSNPYIPLEKENWRGWITKDEVERRGLVCINDFDDKKS